MFPETLPKGTLAARDCDPRVVADPASPGTEEALRGPAAYAMDVVGLFARRGFRVRGTGRVFDPGPHLASR